MKNESWQAVADEIARKKLRRRRRLIVVAASLTTALAVTLGQAAGTSAAGPDTRRPDSGFGSFLWWVAYLSILIGAVIGWLARGARR